MPAQLWAFHFHPSRGKFLFAWNNIAKQFPNVMKPEKSVQEQIDPLFKKAEENRDRRACAYSGKKFG
jgi:hypothetical protein